MEGVETKVVWEVWFFDESGKRRPLLVGESAPPSLEEAMAHAAWAQAGGRYTEVVEVTTTRKVVQP